jgi:hypothetical protein
MAWQADHKCVSSLKRLNHPLSIWEAVKRSRPDADRKAVKKLVDAINESMGFEILDIDDKYRGE